MLNKREIKIFLTFFIIYSFFVQWTSWNEESRFALTRVIVDEDRFEIDSYYNQTGDRAYYNNHYYSDKAPGLSFLAVPTYALWKFVCHTMFTQSSPSLHPDSNVPLVYYADSIPLTYTPDPGFFIRSSMILITIFTSSLFSALTVILIYKISRFFTKDEKYGLLVTLTYGLGTLAFPYALVFLNHALTAFLTFFAFYLLFKIKKEKITDNMYFFLVGISLGFMMMVEYVIFLFLLGCLIYAISIKKSKIFFVLIGCLIGILPLLLYNQSIFGSPFEFTKSHVDLPFWSSSLYYKDITIITLPFFPKFVILSDPYLIFNLLTRLLTSPYRGLFFYHPILILFFIGLFYLYREYRCEAILILFLFISFLLMISLWGVIVDFSFGQRHLLPIIPFLTFPLLYVFKKLDSRIVLTLLSISIFVSLLSLQFWESIHFFNVTSLYDNPNTILDHYLPLFIKNGPRSIIFENLLLEKSIDIRLTLHSCGLTPVVLEKTEIPLFSLFSIGIFTLQIPFLSLIPISMLVFLIWRREITGKIRLNYKQNLLTFFILILIFILGFIRIRNFINEDNWHAPEFHDGKINEDEKWMSQDATLILFNRNKEKEKTNLLFEIEAFNRTRILELYLNGNLIGRHEIYNKKGISQEMELELGKNIVKFYSVSGCDRPTELGLAECDLRCLSFKIGNVHIEDMNKYQLDESTAFLNLYNSSTY